MLRMANMLSNIVNSQEFDKPSSQHSQLHTDMTGSCFEYKQHVVPTTTELTKNQRNSKSLAKSVETRSLTDLPEELLEHICQMIDLKSETSEDKTDLEALATLLNLCRTSRMFRRIAQGYIYHSISLKTSATMARFATSIIENPSLAGLVRSATLHVDNGVEEVAFLTLPDDTHDLQALKYLQTKHGITDSDVNWLILVEILLSRLKNVSELKISWTRSFEIDIMSNSHLFHSDEPMLPFLKTLNVIWHDGEGCFATINTLLRDCKLNKLTAAGLQTTQVDGIEMSECPTLKELAILNSPWLCFRHLQPLTNPFPNLEAFHYYTLG